MEICQKGLVMEKLVILIIVLLSVASTPLTLKKLIDRPKRQSESDDNQSEDDKTEDSG